MKTHRLAQDELLAIEMKIPRIVATFKTPQGKICQRSKWIADVKPLVRLIVPNFEEFSVNQIRDVLAKAHKLPEGKSNVWALGALTAAIKSEFDLEDVGRVLSTSDGANGRKVNLYRRKVNV